MQIVYIKQDGPQIWHSIYAKIIGAHNGGNLADDMVNAAIIPMSALENMLGDTMGYRVFRFTVNPAFNREFDLAITQIEDILSTSRPPWDQNEIMLFVMSQELRLVVDPMAQNLDLLSLLYPIAVVVAVIIALTLSAIVLLQSAKNAAIMRALGMGKGLAILAVGAEYLIACIFGIVIGIATVFIIRGGLYIDTVAAVLPYFAGAFVGTMAGAIYVAGRRPLDLLQVRE